MQNLEKVVDITLIEFLLVNVPADLLAFDLYRGRLSPNLRIK